MAQNRTVQNENSVRDFLNSVEHDVRRADGWALLEMMQKATGTEAKMWGPAIIGFGSHHYRYASGREGDMPRIGFSPRKANLALYLAKKSDPDGTLLPELGKYKTGVGCLYINRLADVDLDILQTMLEKAWRYKLPEGESY